jgi:hypothetical protein
VRARAPQMCFIVPTTHGIVPPGIMAGLRDELAMLEKDEWQYKKPSGSK